MHTRRQAGAPRTRPTLRLRRTEWERRMKALGLETDTDRSAHIGIDRTTVYRVQTGETAPGEKFVAAVLFANPEARFEDFFEIVAEGAI